MYVPVMCIPGYDYSSAHLIQYCELLNERLVHHCVFNVDAVYTSQSIFLKSYSWNFKKFILLNTVLVERRVKFLSPQTNSGVKRVAAKSSIVEEN